MNTPLRTLGEYVSGLHLPIDKSTTSANTMQTVCWSFSEPISAAMGVIR
jgi:hypothetical protein